MTAGGFKVRTSSLHGRFCFLDEDAHDFTFWMTEAANGNTVPLNKQSMTCHASDNIYKKCSFHIPFLWIKKKTNKKKKNKKNTTTKCDTNLVNCVK